MKESNPYKLSLIMAAKQAAIILDEINKMIGLKPHDSLPLMQLTRAIYDFEKWEEQHP